MNIRLATAADAGPILAIYAPMVTSTAVSFELDPPTATDMAARIQATMPAYPWLVLEQIGQIIGYAYAGPFASRGAYRWSVETTVYVAADARGRGAGRGLYGALLPLLGAQGFFQAFAGIALPNPASVALHERAGFAFAARYDKVGWKLGDWHDVGWWQAALRPACEVPRPPRRLDELGEPTITRSLSTGMEFLRA